MSKNNFPTWKKISLSVSLITFIVGFIMIAIYLHIESAAGLLIGAALVAMALISASTAFLAKEK
ncbi:hypothetical protein ABZ512_01685 [Nocardiopsis dassonvillei]